MDALLQLAFIASLLAFLLVSVSHESTPFYSLRRGMKEVSVSHEWEALENAPCELLSGPLFVHFVNPVHERSSTGRTSLAVARQTHPPINPVSSRAEQLGAPRKRGKRSRGICICFFAHRREQEPSGS
jgi:hypothetical protein